MSKLDDCEFPSCLGILVYFIISGFVFVVCSSRTIFGKRKMCPRAFGKLETWLRGGRAKHGVYAVAVVMVAMARTCTCNCQLRCGSAFLDVGITVHFVINV